MTALQILNQMIRDDDRRAHPDMPEAWLPNKPMKCNSANSLTQCIKRFLTLKGHQCDRVSTTGRPLDNTRVVENVLGQRMRIGSMKWIPGTGTRGKADLNAKIRRHPSDEFAVPVEIEVKWGRDRIRPEQVEYAEATERAGGVYVIARDFEEFYNWYVRFTEI